MTIAYRYLVWDGYYSTHGVCNQRRDPAQDVFRCQLHLRRLGFYEGPIDGQANADFKNAVRHYRYFPDKPPMTGDITYRTGPALGQTVTLPYPASELDRNLLEQARHANDDQLDDRLVEALDAALPYPPAVPTREEDFDVLFAAGRLPMAADGLSATLNSDALAVSIVSVPATFTPGAQLGKIRIRLSRYESILSMLVRIYRNFDPATEELPAEHLVYEEVLYRDDITALPDATEEQAAPVHAEAAEVAAIIRAKHWRQGPYFLMKEHAPYKVRCWVSTRPEAFDRFADPAKIDNWGPHRQDTFEMYRGFMQLRAALLGLGEAGEPVEDGSVVHDQSRPDTRDFTGDDDTGVSLIEEPCATHDAAWTERHASRYFQDPRPAGFVDELLQRPVDTYMDLWRQRTADDQFKALYLRETLEEVYKHVGRLRQSLCCGRDCAADADVKAQIEETLQAIEEECLGLWRQRCPYRSTVEFCAAVAATAEWIIHHTRTLPEMHHYQLRGRRPDGREELNWTWLQHALSHERNIAVQRDDEPNSYLSELVQDAEQRGCLELFRGVVSERTGSLLDSAIGRGNERVRRAIEESNIILVPSYSPLDEAFFTRTRQVPVFMVGLIDLPYLNADAHRYTPWQFFNHDLFHTISNGPAGARMYSPAPQMWHWMRNHLVEALASPPPDAASTITALLHVNSGAWLEREGRERQRINFPAPVRRDGFPDPERRAAICTVWNDNATILRGGRHAETDPDYRLAYDIVLFCLLHEPVRSQQEYTRCFFPAVPDPDDLRRRTGEAPGIMDEIRERARAHWFGPPSVVTDGVLGRMDDAFATIDGLLDQLTPTRAVVNDVFRTLRLGKAR